MNLKIGIETNEGIVWVVMPDTLETNAWIDHLLDCDLEVIVEYAYT